MFFIGINSFICNKNKVVESIEVCETLALLDYIIEDLTVNNVSHPYKVPRLWHTRGRFRYDGNSTEDHHARPYRTLLLYNDMRHDPRPRWPDQWCVKHTKKSPAESLRGITSKTRWLLSNSAKLESKDVTAIGLTGLPDLPLSIPNNRWTWKLWQFHWTHSTFKSSVV